MHERGKPSHYYTTEHLRRRVYSSETPCGSHAPLRVSCPRGSPIRGTGYNAALQHPDFASYDLSSLTAVSAGAAPVPVSLMEQVKERNGADIAIVFGQTEGSCCITSTLPDDPFELKATTVGKPLPYVDVKIINPATGKVVPVGERGEFCYRGFLAMQGYYHMPEKTAETIDSEGWLHSGDLVTMNAQGYVNESFPMTASGKVQKFVLRENAIKALGLTEVARTKTA